MEWPFVIFNTENEVTDINIISSDIQFFEPILNFFRIAIYPQNNNKNNANGCKIFLLIYICNHNWQQIKVEVLWLFNLWLKALIMGGCSYECLTVKSIGPGSTDSWFYVNFAIPILIQTIRKKQLIKGNFSWGSLEIHWQATLIVKLYWN